MAEENKLFGFKEPDAKALKSIATAYQLGSPYKGQTHDGAFRGGNAAGLWVMQATTDISAASGATFGTGTGKLKHVSSTAIADYTPGSSTVTKTVNNLFEDVIGIGRVFICSRTLDGQLWVTNVWALKPMVEFVLTAALTTADASATATFSTQHGGGVSNGQATIPTLYNLQASTAYIFEGAIGARGMATIANPFASDDDAAYTIIQMECATASSGGDDSGGGGGGGGGGSPGGGTP